jgi:hypothetical protein
MERNATLIYSRTIVFGDYFNLASVPKYFLSVSDILDILLFSVSFTSNTGTYLLLYGIELVYLCEQLCVTAANKQKYFDSRHSPQYAVKCSPKLQPSHLGPYIFSSIFFFSNDVSPYSCRLFTVHTNHTFESYGERSLSI